MAHYQQGCKKCQRNETELIKRLRNLNESVKQIQLINLTLLLASSALRRSNKDILTDMNISDKPVNISCGHRDARPPSAEPQTGSDED